MAGKSGRSINNVPENPVKKMIFSWEGNPGSAVYCWSIFSVQWFSEFYNVEQCAQADAGLSGRSIYHAANGIHTGSWRDRYLRWMQLYVCPQP